MDKMTFSPKFVQAFMKFLEFGMFNGTYTIESGEMVGVGIENGMIVITNDTAKFSAEFSMDDFISIMNDFIGNRIINWQE